MRLATERVSYRVTTQSESLVVLKTAQKQIWNVLDVERRCLWVASTSHRDVYGFPETRRKPASRPTCAVNIPRRSLALRRAAPCPCPSTVFTGALALRLRSFILWKYGIKLFTTRFGIFHTRFVSSNVCQSCCGMLMFTSHFLFLMFANT